MEQGPKYYLEQLTISWWQLLPWLWQLVANFYEFKHASAALAPGDDSLEGDAPIGGKVRWEGEEEDGRSHNKEYIKDL